MLEPLPPAKPRRGEPPEVTVWAQSMRREINLHMKIGWLEGRIEALQELLARQERVTRRLTKRLARLEARL